MPLLPTALTAADGAVVDRRSIMHGRSGANNPARASEHGQPVPAVPATH